MVNFAREIFELEEKTPVDIERWSARGLFYAFVVQFQELSEDQDENTGPRLAVALGLERYVIF